MQPSLLAWDRPPGFSELAFDASMPPTHLGCFTEEFEGTFSSIQRLETKNLSKAFKASRHSTLSTSTLTSSTGDNFVKALRFSPCGSLLACSSDDNYLRLFEVPPEAVALGKEAPWPPPRRRRKRRRRKKKRKEEDESSSDSSESESDGGDAAVPSTPRISLARSWLAGDIVHDLSFHPLGGAENPEQGGGSGGGCCLAFGPPLLAVAARHHPVHLLGPLAPLPSPPSSSAARGKDPSSQPHIIASFVPLDQAVEPATTTALCFTPDGATLALGGHAGSVALFDVSRPGKSPRAVIPAPASSSSKRSRRTKKWKGSSSAVLSFGSGGFGSNGGIPLQFGKRRRPGRSYDGDGGGDPVSASASAPSSSSSYAAPLTHGPLRGGTSMVSSLACSSAVSPSLPPLLAIGFVSGSVSVAHPQTGEVLLSLEGGHADAATALTWSPCGWYLYSAARRDGAVRCWDVRRGEGPVESDDGYAAAAAAAAGCALSLSRASQRTQQRIGLCVEPVAGRHLLSGGEDGWVRAFDLRGEWQASRRQQQQWQASVSPFYKEKGETDEEATGGGGENAAVAAPSPSASTSTGWRVSREAVAAVAIHPWLPLVAAGSGCRRFRGGEERRGRRKASNKSGSESDGSKSDKDDADETGGLPRAALSLWRPSYTWHERDSAAAQ